MVVTCSPCFLWICVAGNMCGSQNSWKYDGRCICQSRPFFLQDLDALLLLLENAFIMPTCEASNGNLFLLLSDSISKLVLVVGTFDAVGETLR